MNFAIASTGSGYDEILDGEYGSIAKVDPDYINLLAAAPDLLVALKRAKRYADSRKLQLLNECGCYSDKAFQAATESSIWKQTMADCEAIDKAIAQAEAR